MFEAVAFIAIFVLVLTILVVIHEAGHFFVAKAAGVKVLEFGVGFPPRLWGIRRGETVYTVNAIPLGGFVKMVGEEDPSEPGSLASKSARNRSSATLTISLGWNEKLMNRTHRWVPLTGALARANNSKTNEPR